MLTLILLVVLGGGAGLLAVWLVDARGLSRLLGRFAPGSLRPTRRGGTTATPPSGTSATEPAPAAPGPEQAAFEPVGTPLAPLPASAPAGRRGQKKIPSAYTAVEGTYREVARVPLWRKLVSLVFLLLTLAVIGVGIAAVAGAAFGLVAELVDGAVG
ncbi:hypothetical protein NHL50_00065 [Acidimicrobiia bacterium EGI L10123]|uniref:hypothetical protein n=1 Tax=Salinilacustrithrix flava TaxID=2957203 RepID=UPI003D7C184E|nr:hypothetical protein [Acidimicrobiia bacterium EGI L10123]